MAKLRVKNVAAGFVDPSGTFHPLRGSRDYDPDRADEDGSKSDGRGGVRGKRTGRKVDYKSSRIKKRVRAQASHAGAKGAAAKKQYGRGRKSNPESPLTQTWKEAKVRMTKEGDIQVMLPVGRTVKGARKAARKTVKRGIKRVVKRVRAAGKRITRSNPGIHSKADHAWGEGKKYAARGGSRPTWKWDQLVGAGGLTSAYKHRFMSGYRAGKR